MDSSARQQLAALRILRCTISTCGDRRTETDAETAEDAGLRTGCDRDGHLPSYGAALNDLGMKGKHITVGRSNNRAENSHLPIRQRERRMQKFKSAASAQRFLSTHAAVYNTFNVQRHLISRKILRQFRGEAMRTWQAAAAAA